MNKIHKSVDLNAYISNLKCAPQLVEGNKQLSITFDNLGYGTIVAVKIEINAKDSFGDEIDFGGKKTLEIKKTDLNIKPRKKAGFIYESNNYDIKEITRCRIVQIIYENGENVSPREMEIVDYEVEVFNSSKSYEKEVLEYIKEINNKAICYPKMHDKGWICICGNLNREDLTTCNACGAIKREIFNRITPEKIKDELEKREEIKKENEERLTQQKIILEENRKKKEKAKKFIVIGLMAVLLAAIIITSVYRNAKYGLSDEEAKKYNIALNNYEKINSFVNKTKSNYSNLAFDYWMSSSYDDDSMLDEAEEDTEYIYLRGMYIASPLLYELLRDQFPDKYYDIYNRIVQLQKEKAYNDYLGQEKYYIMLSDLNHENFEKRDQEEDSAISVMESYLRNNTLNVDKVEMKEVSNMPKPNYSEVWGINIGAIFSEDGSIKYIGEFSDGLANGYGYFYYTNSQGSNLSCSGIFEDGEFIKDDNGRYIDNVPKVTGEFVSVSGLTNTDDIERMLDKKAAERANDKDKAVKECDKYVKMLIDKQSNIKRISWSKYPTVSDDKYYKFDCTVEYDDLTREGTITIVKKSDGSFEADGLKYKSGD